MYSLYIADISFVVKLSASVAVPSTQSWQLPTSCHCAASLPAPAWTTSSPSHPPAHSTPTTQQWPPTLHVFLLQNSICSGSLAPAQAGDIIGGHTLPALHPPFCDCTFAAQDTAKQSAMGISAFADGEAGIGLKDPPVQQVLQPPSLRE